MLGNIGDLRPNDHTVLVAQIVKILVVLIMGKANGVCADLPDQVHIFFVHFPGDGVTQALSVLMAANAPQRVGAAIEEKALLGVSGKIPDTKPSGNFIRHFPIHHQLQPGGVEIGIFQAVPQMHTGNGQLCIGAASCRHRMTKIIQQRHFHFALGGIVPAANPNLTVLIVVHRLGSDLHARAAKIVQIKMMLADDQQLHIPVNAAVKGKIRLLGVDPVVFFILHLHLQVVFFLQIRRQLHPEGGITALVTAKALAVEGHFRLGIDTGKLQIHQFPGFVECRHGEGLFIHRSGAQIVVTAVLAV